MNIILLGPPGAGKGTQADYICEQLHIPKISTGDMLRSLTAASILGETPLQKEVKQFLNAGKLVPDSIIVQMVKDRIAEPDCGRGFLLDGFPRTIGQAEALQQQGVHIDVIIQLQVPDEDVIQRLSGRRVHPGSGRTYHVLFNPPKVEGKDDLTGEQLRQRRDDEEETVRKRLDVYKQQTQPLVAWYQQISKDQKIKYIGIDGSVSVETVKAQIIAVLTPANL